MKKTCLCIMGLLLLGTLCVPVAAETGDQDSWWFYIGNRIVATSEVKLNDHRCNDSIFQKVYVPTSLDEVEVQFEVVAGPDTTLTITKDYVNMLREKDPDLDPALVAWGGIQTYDVDGGCIKFPAGQTNPAICRYHFRPYDHFKERAFLHLTPGRNEHMEMDGSTSVQKIYVRS